jgi:hypothetical protein
MPFHVFDLFADLTNLFVFSQPLGSSPEACVLASNLDGFIMRLPVLTESELIFTSNMYIKTSAARNAYC